MTWLDYVLLGVIALSALISLVRGALREVLSLLAWGSALGVSLWWSPSLADWLSAYIVSELWRYSLALVGLFVITLILFLIVNHLIVQVVRKTGGGATDRMLGLVFGSLRGMVLVLVLIALVGITPLAMAFSTSLRYRSWSLFAQSR